MNDRVWTQNVGPESSLVFKDLRQTLDDRDRIGKVFINGKWRGQGYNIN